MISTAGSRKLPFANDNWPSSNSKSDYINQTYTSVKFYGRNQNLFTRLVTQNSSNPIKLRQHFNPKLHPLQHISEPIKSSSTKIINAISNKDDNFLDTEEFSATKAHVSLSLNPWKKKDYYAEKKTNYYLRFTPNLPTSKPQKLFRKQNLDFFKPLSSYKTYGLKNSTLERQSNDVLMGDEFKGSPIDLFSLDLSSSVVVPLKNVTRLNRQSQQQNVATTTTVSTTAVTTSTTSTTVSTTGATTTSTTVSTTAATTTTISTTAQPNSCYTQTCDQTITGRQLSYSRFITFKYQ